MKKIILILVIPLCFACFSVNLPDKCSANPPHVAMTFFHPDAPFFKEGMLLSCTRENYGIVAGAGYKTPTYKQATIAYKYHDTSTVCNIVKEVGRDVVATINPSDSCYFILAPNDVLIRDFDSLELTAGFSKIERNRLVPYLGLSVPNEHVSPKTCCGLKDNYTILILKAGEEDIVTDSVKMEFEYLPPRLKHGYRSGIAYSVATKTIIYWSMAW